MNDETSRGVLARRLGDFSPSVGLVLGSGLGFFADACIEDPIRVRYAELPEFPRTTVEGHEGQFVAGTVGGVRVLCMQGRFHYYEGYTLEDVTLPIRLMAQLGVRDLILTNAAGGIHPDFSPGDLMVIEDHINFTGANPLRGPNLNVFGVRFPDMTEAYSADRRLLLAEVAAEQGVRLQRGVYIGVSGPSFETPAEIRAFRALGADAVGMSTVPECIVARHCGINVLGISCITNYAAGMNEQPLTHEEVAQTANRVKTTFSNLVAGVIRRMGSVPAPASGEKPA